MASKRVTIIDVASRAGVSKSAVSDIMNRGLADSYPEATQQRVLQAMRELGYRPHRSAQRLRKGKSDVIGVMLTRGFGNPFYPRLFDLIRRHLAEHKLSTDLISPPESGSDGEAFLTMASPRDLDALIVGPLYNFDQRLIKQITRLSDWGTKVAAFGALDSLEPASVYYQMADEQAGRVASHELISMGHRKLGFFGACDDELRHLMSGTFQAGIEAGLSDHEDVQLTGTWVCGDKASYEVLFIEARKVVEDWLQMSPSQRPSAIVCRNDQLALTLLRAMIEQKVSVPEQISILGFDNVPEAQLGFPALSTVDPETNSRIAAFSASCVSLVSSESTSHQEERELPPPRFIHRETTAPR